MADGPADFALPLRKPGAKKTANSQGRKPMADVPLFDLCAAEKAVIQRMAEETEKLLAVIEDPAKEKKDSKPKEPPIVFKTINAKDEYNGLCKSLGNLAGPEDRQAMSEIKEYAVEDEGAWALSDDTIHFIGKLLHDKSLPAGVRAHLLRLLAASALKDDIILLLHQDRKEHLLMNYAHDFDRLPTAEQDALTFFICNLFENTGTSEWLLYISEWSKDGSNSLSNVRVTTKIAVNSLLSDNKEIQEKGTAIMHNLAGKEKLARNSVIRKVLPRGSKSQVFDDVATELSMAILQYLAGNPPEEYLFRVLKSLLKFCQISYNDVPALIKMIGPEPKKFKGVSPRVDDLIDKISVRVDGAAYRQPEVPA